MSYSPLSQDELSHLKDRESKLHKQLRTCTLVDSTLSSQGWKEIILPSLDRMIAEELGGRVGNNWTYGKISKATSTDNVWFRLGYKQGLMEFSNHVYNYLKMLEITKNQLNGIAQERKGEFEVPMMNVPYNIQKKVPDGKQPKRKKNSKVKPKKKKVQKKETKDKEKD